MLEWTAPGRGEHLGYLWDKVVACGYLKHCSRKTVKLLERRLPKIKLHWDHQTSLYWLYDPRDKLMKRGSDTNLGRLIYEVDCIGKRRRPTNGP